ncbi:hypothetical protein ABZP36_008118 [Zizania latifolia]
MPSCWPSSPSSNRLLGYVSTDSDDDRFHCYEKPVSKGNALRIVVDKNGTLRCPICPGMNLHGWTWDDTKNHVVGIARSKSEKHDDKKKSHHHRLARNHRWM